MKKAFNSMRRIRSAYFNRFTAIPVLMTRRLNYRRNTLVPRGINVPGSISMSMSFHVVAIFGAGFPLNRDIVISTKNPWIGMH